ncbi:MAG: hypothetical protein AAGG01_17040, partial [Planctomycetota bacterium]
MHDPLRPTFEHSVPGMEAGALVERIHRVLADPETGLPHRRAGQHLLVWLPKGDQHLWSPWLHIDVSNSESEPGTATIFGRFTPAPSLWTGIMSICSHGDHRCWSPLGSHTRRCCPAR